MNLLPLMGVRLDSTHASLVAEISFLGEDFKVSLVSKVSTLWLTNLVFVRYVLLLRTTSRVGINCFLIILIRFSFFRMRIYVQFFAFSGRKTLFFVILGILSYCTNFCDINVLSVLFIIINWNNFLFAVGVSQEFRFLRLFPGGNVSSFLLAGFNSCGWYTITIWIRLTPSLLVF